MSDCFHHSLSSLPCSEHEKKATGLSFWFRVAAKATSDALASTLNGILSLKAVTNACLTIFLRLSNVSTASGDSGKELELLIGFIRSEN